MPMLANSKSEYVVLTLFRTCNPFSLPLNSMKTRSRTFPDVDEKC